MAEVVGIVAGAVQFLDVGSRVLISLSRFCSDLQHVPRKIKRVRRQLEQTLQLVESIKSDVEAPNTGPGTTLAGIISQPQVDIAKSLLKEAAVQVTELQVLLDKIALTGSGFVEKTWRAVVAMKKEEDILWKCGDIGTTAGLLQAWMQHQSLVLIREDILVNQDNATKISLVDQKLGTVQQSFDDMPKAIEDIVQTSQGAVLREIGINRHYLDENTRRLEQNIDIVRQEVLQEVTTTEASMHGMLQSLKGGIVDEILRDRTSRSSESQALHSQLASMQQMMNQILIKDTSQCLLSKPSYLKDIEVGARNASSRFSFSGSSLIRNRPGNYALCTCTTRRTQSYKTWRNFRFRYDPTLAHDATCPLHPRSNTSWTIGVRAALPALWSYCIDVALNIDFGAGGLTVCPSIRRAARMVERRASSVFCSLDNLRSYVMVSALYRLKNPNWESHERRAFETFRINLCRIFRDGSATAFDQADTETTVLSCFLSLCHPGWNCLNSTHVYDLVISIIELLFEGGAEGNPNGLFQHHSTNTLPYNSVYYTSMLSYPDCIVDMSKFGGIYDAHELLEIWQDAGVWAELDLPPRYAAALQKSLPLLEESIENNTFEKCHRLLPSVLTFALHWPEGRRLLLAAGADPWTSIRYALELGDLDALMDLIHKDLRFFSLESLSNLLNMWVTYWTPKLSEQSECNASLDLLINHLVQLRKRLLDLAREHFTSHTQRKFHIDGSSPPEDVLDCYMLQIYRALISNGVNTPSFLYPGCQSSIYHLPYLNTLVAERLFRAGFRKIDFKDENGVRPVAIACRKGDPNLILWYLQHGAVPHESLIWDLAASFGDFIESNDAVEKIISMCGYPERDDCRCHCSSQGCLPSTVLQKQARSSQFSNFDLQLWVKCIPERSQFEAYREGCRLEVFERLGMSHTCCRFIRERDTDPHMRQKFAIDDGCDIREEEQDFAVILDQYLCLFDQLWLEFRGSFKTYWNAWWSAMAMMLPCPASPTDLRGLTLVCGSIPKFSVGAYWRRHCDTQSGFDFTEEYGPHEKLIRWIVGQYSNVESSLVRFFRLSGHWYVLRTWIRYCIDVGIDPPYSYLGHNGIIHIPEDFNLDCLPEDLITYPKNLASFALLFLDPTERAKEAKKFISEKLLPTIVPTIILEIGFGRSIPEDLRRHFEAEGLLQDGVLVRPTFKENLHL